MPGLSCFIWPFFYNQCKKSNLLSEHFSQNVMRFLHYWRMSSSELIREDLSEAQSYNSMLFCFSFPTSTSHNIPEEEKYGHGSLATNHQLNYFSASFLGNHVSSLGFLSSLLKRECIALHSRNISHLKSQQIAKKPCEI